MKLKWIGKYNGDNLPSVTVSEDAKPLPEVTSKSVLLLIPICAIFALLAYVKYKFLGGLAFSRESWMLGLAVALLFTPIHELIHAACFPKGSEVFMFYTAQGLGITCTAPMSKARYTVLNLMPTMLLGVLSLLLFMIIPHTYAFASTMLCVFSLVHLGCGYADILNVIHAAKLPKDAVIQISGERVMWYSR